MYFIGEIEFDIVSDRRYTLLKLDRRQRRARGRKPQESAKASAVVPGQPQSHNDVGR
jgi:hypothetical protein